MLEVTTGNKDTVGDTQRCFPAETVVTDWDSTREIGEPSDTWRWEKSWAAMDPDPDSLGTDQIVGFCEKLGTC